MQVLLQVHGLKNKNMEQKNFVWRRNQNNIEPPMPLGARDRDGDSKIFFVGKRKIFFILKKYLQKKRKQC
jgi:hypothetical protein